MRAVRLFTSVIRAFTSAPAANSISSVAIDRSCTSAASGLKRGAGSMPSPAAAMSGVTPITLGTSTRAP
jgi:hypothetical protein